MSVDITLQAAQEEIGDSILEGNNIVAVLPHQGNLHPQDVGSDAEHGESQFDNPEDYFAEAFYEQEHDAQKLGDEGLRQKLAKEGQQAEEQPVAERLTLSLEERIARQEEAESQARSQERPPTAEVSPQELAPEQYRAVSRAK